MTLPLSGLISLADIAAEFGGTPPYSLSDYYGVAPGVPTSGTISFSDFYGKSAGAIMTVGQNDSSAGFGYYNPAGTVVYGQLAGEVGGIDPDDILGIIEAKYGVIGSLVLTTDQSLHGKKSRFTVDGIAITGTWNEEYGVSNLMHGSDVTLRAWSLAQKVGQQLIVKHQFL